MTRKYHRNKWSYDDEYDDYYVQDESGSTHKGDAWGDGPGLKYTIQDYEKATKTTVPRNNRYSYSYRGGKTKKIKTNKRKSNKRKSKKRNYYF